MARRPTRAAPAAPARPETPYQKRIRLYKERHPGATTQEARGKPRAEHRIRKAREVHEDTTTYQRGYIRKWAAGQARKVGANADYVYETMLEKVIKRGRDGFADFRAMVDGVRRLAREKARLSKAGRIEGRARRAGEMEDWAAEWDIDLEWLYYG